MVAMLGIHDFGVFLVAGILLNLTPGQDTLYVVGRTLAQGRSIGLASALGIGAGGIVHTLAAALGLSALLAASASAFTVLKLVGAGYLVFLGVSLLASRSPAAGPGLPGASVSAGRAFCQGVLTNVTNPKVALFFLAFLPQFIAPDGRAKMAAFLLLGSTFIVTGTLWCLVLVVFAARLRGTVAERRGVRSFLTRVTGALFVALGIRLAVSRP